MDFLKLHMPQTPLAKVEKSPLARVELSPLARVELSPLARVEITPHEKREEPFEMALPPDMAITEHQRPIGARTTYNTPTLIPHPLPL